jgi:transcriptional regulator with XRE-family HTH domain
MDMDGAELKQRRKALKLTQDQMADRLGLHRNMIGLMERGLQPISDRTALAVTALRFESGSTGAPRQAKLVDPMERIIEQALIDAGIAFRTDQDGGTETALDFYLPAYDVSIEVKRFYTARTGEQMARAPNVIVAQGERAVRFLAAAIRSGDFFHIAARS